MSVQPDPLWRPVLKSRLMAAAGVLVLWVIGIEARIARHGLQALLHTFQLADQLGRDKNRADTDVGPRGVRVLAVHGGLEAIAALVAVDD